MPILSRSFLDQKNRLLNRAQKPICNRWEAIDEGRLFILECTGRLGFDFRRGRKGTGRVEVLRLRGKGIFVLCRESKKSSG